MAAQKARGKLLRCSGRLGMDVLGVYETAKPPSGGFFVF